MSAPTSSSESFGLGIFTMLYCLYNALAVGSVRTMVSGDLSQLFSQSALLRAVTPRRSGPAILPLLPMAWHPEHPRRMKRVLPRSAEGVCARRVGAQARIATRTRPSELKRWLAITLVLAGEW